MEAKYTLKRKRESTPATEIQQCADELNSLCHKITVFQQAPTVQDYATALELAKTAIERALETITIINTNKAENNLDLKFLANKFKLLLLVLTSSIIVVAITARSPIYYLMSNDCLALIDKFKTELYALYQAYQQHQLITELDTCTAHILSMQENLAIIASSFQLGKEKASSQPPSSKEERLLSAVLARNLERVKFYVLTEKADINYEVPLDDNDSEDDGDSSEEESGRKLLRTSSILEKALEIPNNKDVIRFLLSCKPRKLERAFLYAIRLGDVGNMLVFLEHDPTLVNKSWQGQTPLMETAEYSTDSKFILLQWLLFLGADPSPTIKNKQKKSALDIAKSFKNQRFIDLLTRAQPTPSSQLKTELLLALMFYEYDSEETTALAAKLYGDEDDEEAPDQANAKKEAKEQQRDEKAFVPLQPVEEFPIHSVVSGLEKLLKTWFFPGYFGLDSFARSKDTYITIAKKYLTDELGKDAKAFPSKAALQGFIHLQLLTVKTLPNYLMLKTQALCLLSSYADINQWFSKALDEELPQLATQLKTDMDKGKITAIAKDLTRIKKRFETEYGPKFSKPATPSLQPLVSPPLAMR